MRLFALLLVLVGGVGSLAEAQTPQPRPSFDAQRFIDGVMAERKAQAEARRKEVPPPVSIGATDYLRGRASGLGAYNRAVELAVNDKHEAAIKEYSAAIKAIPDLAEAHYGMGISLHWLRRFDEAVIRFREALQLKPGDTRSSKALTRSTRAIEARSQP